MSKVRTGNINQIPDELLNDKELNLQIKQLPENYNFEIHKTIWRIKTIQAKRGEREYLFCFVNLVSLF
jgi:2-(3-amino-3-carboxypropyl)histidine synthase